MDCRKCGKDKINVIETIEERADGSRHIECTCGACGEFLFYKQWQDNSAFIMLFGKKHKGKTISAIVKEDISYAEWAAENMKNNIGRRFAEELELKKGDGPKQTSMELGQTNNTDAPF